MQIKMMWLVRTKKVHNHNQIPNIQGKNIFTYNI